MKKLTHDEIAANRLTPDSIPDERRLPVVAVIENVRSLYNVGSIFRTADGALIRQLCLTGFTPRPPRKEIEKTALGATRSIPWVYASSPLEPISTLRAEGYNICCLELTTNSRPYYQIEKRDFPLCLVVGNEVSGISKEVISQCAFSLEIPMFGTKQSLNVSVAFGVAIFELSRIWRLPQS